MQLLSSAGSTQQTSEQLQCSLLSKLPLDVRLMIYELVLGGMVFHLSAFGPRFRILLYICNRPDRIDDQPHECHSLSTKAPSAAPRQDFQDASGLLPLLVTCRQVYSEAIHVLYSANVFEFRQNSAAFRFLKMMIPPQRLQSIRRFRWHMRIPHHPNTNGRSRRDWSGLFEFFTNEMTGLQHLLLQIQTMQPMEAEIRETSDDEGMDWVRPMVEMAVTANRKRGCKVDIVTAGVTHDPVKEFKELSKGDPGLSSREVLQKTCTRFHERIRVSLITKA